MDDLTKQIEREVCGEYNPAGPSLRIGDQSFPAPGNPFLVETYRALLAAAVRLVESRAKAAPDVVEAVEVRLAYGSKARHALSFLAAEGAIERVRMGAYRARREQDNHGTPRDGGCADTPATRGEE